jgi:hypothetical protein
LCQWPKVLQLPKQQFQAMAAPVLHSSGVMIALLSVLAQQMSLVG